LLRRRFVNAVPVFTALVQKLLSHIHVLRSFVQRASATVEAGYAVSVNVHSVSRTVWRRLSEPFGTSTDLDSSTDQPNGEKQWAFAGMQTNHGAAKQFCLPRKA